MSTYSRRVLRGLRTRRHEADAGIIDRMWCSRCAGGCSRCSPWPSISTDKRRSECCAVVAVFGPSSSCPRLVLPLGTKMRCAHIPAQCFLARLGFIASGTVAKIPNSDPPLVILNSSYLHAYVAYHVVASSLLYCHESLPRRRRQIVAIPSCSRLQAAGRCLASRSTNRTSCVH